MHARDSSDSDSNEIKCVTFNDSNKGMIRHAITAPDSVRTITDYCCECRLQKYVPVNPTSSECRLTTSQILYLYFFRRGSAIISLTSIPSVRNWDTRGEGGGDQDVSRKQHRAK